MICLTAPGLVPFVVDDHIAGINCSNFDPGYPVVREVSDPEPDRDGTSDRTQHFGARVVTALFQLWVGDGGITSRQHLDRLALYCHPGQRSELTFTDPAGGGVRRMLVRASEVSAPIVDPNDATTVATSWVCPSGLIESADVATATITPSASASGRTYPLEYPRTYPGPLPALGSTIAQAGTIGAWPTTRIHGPCTGPQLINVTTGQAISFPGLVIAAGEVLELDHAAGTVLLDGVADRYSSFDFATSTWWQLPPGPSLIRFDAETLESPARAEISWRHTYLL